MYRLYWKGYYKDQICVFAFLIYSTSVYFKSTM